MKYDPNEIDVIRTSKTKPQLRRNRSVCAVAAIVLASVTSYFMIGLLGIFS